MGGRAVFQGDTGEGDDRVRNGGLEGRGSGRRGVGGVEGAEGGVVELDDRLGEGSVFPARGRSGPFRTSRTKKGGLISS